MITFKSKRFYGGIIMAACLMVSTGYAKTFKPVVEPQKQQAYRIGEDVEVQPSVNMMEVASRSYTIKHPGAAYIKPNFTLNLSEGDYITVSNPDGTESYQYPFGGPEYIEDVDGSIWSLSIEGDTAVITVHSEREVGGSLSDFGVVINKFERGYSESEKAGANFQIENTCGSDNKQPIECVKSTYPNVYEKRNATARLLLSGSLCTGFLVSNTGLLMTNNHCVDTQSGVARMEAQFNYKNISCYSGSKTSGVKIAGSSLITTSASLDMSLVKLADVSRVQQYGYYQLDGSRQSVGKQVYIIHHPQGSPKKASVQEDRSNTGMCIVESTSRYGGTDLSYRCDTEGGSSGSPVFSFSDNRVIGLHHYGGCHSIGTNSGVKMELILPKVKQYIGGGTDPGDTQAPTVPTGLQGTAGKTSVSLSWNASSDNVGVSSYVVYKDGYQVGTTGSTQYTVSGLAANTTYTFQVKAKDAAGNSSALSSQISVTTLKDGSGGGDGTWTAYKYYSIGDVVTYGGYSYRCVQAHTAYPGWTPDVVAALWSRM